MADTTAPANRLNPAEVLWDLAALLDVIHARLECWELGFCEPNGLAVSHTARAVSVARSTALELADQLEEAPSAMVAMAATAEVQHG